MKKYLLAALLTLHAIASWTQSTVKPWDNGNLVVSSEGRYLKHTNGIPFFWQGETAWLLPERLNRDEAEYYLEHCRNNGYNVVQVQTVNEVPAINIYGEFSMPDGFHFENINCQGRYGYWDHMDFIVEAAKARGIYVGMVCIWGNLVKKGKMNVEQAKAYGKFLAERYGSQPNIIWIIGGDICGDVKTEVWQALAETIKSIDSRHLMTFHPRGRTSSAKWFNQVSWLDFNIFQSGHRRYGQEKGEKNYPIKENTEEDNWQYVAMSQAESPLKPVLDGEPIYEDIPQGLHDPAEPRWNAADVRRYAYWSVFAGSCGHTYGHNSIMQMLKPGVNPAYGARKMWYEALKDPGFRQMQYLKKLMLTFPYFERVPDQKVIEGDIGERYDRIVATRGKDYILIYNYSGRPMEINLSLISGKKKNAWWYNPADGTLAYIGEFNDGITGFRYDGAYMNGGDRVLIVVDASKDYILKEQKGL